MALRLIIIGIRMRMRASKTGFLKSKKKNHFKLIPKGEPKPVSIQNENRYRYDCSVAIRMRFGHVAPSSS